jgi:hypothetical protein
VKIASSLLGSRGASQWALRPPNKSTVIPTYILLVIADPRRPDADAVAQVYLPVRLKTAMHRRPDRFGLCNLS